MSSFYTVVCTDNKDYINWQFELLEYTWSRIKQQGELVRLVSSKPDQPLPPSRHATQIRTEPTNVHPISGDVYPCYNRLYSLQEWLKDEAVDGTILIVDPDVVFRMPVQNMAEPGSPVGQHWLDFGLGGSFRETLLDNTTADPDSLQPVTWPAQIHSSDLRRILPRWIELTVAVREETRRQESDMHAFVAAAAEAGLTFRLEATSAFMPWSDEAVGHAPLIHYCQPVEAKDGSRIWFKHDYKPWELVDRHAKPALRYCRDLIALVNEYASLLAVEKQHSHDTIFIAIAAYCEPELVETIRSCLNNARVPENLRFGICLQYDNSDPLTSETCLDEFSQDRRVRYVLYPFEQSEGGCWARNIAQQLYNGETYTLQIDSHTRMIESWDTILISMLRSLPSARPLITEFPPLYYKKDGNEFFDHIGKFSNVNTHVAERWDGAGWLQHTQKLMPWNDTFPRPTRLLSGAFVFTLGQWNIDVRQDPKHFYTGEEFALALRSYSSGYDLFDPNQIVAWHRCHPAPNRKFRDDNSVNATREKHRQGVHRLRLLWSDDSDNELGDFGLGSVRSLEDYRAFSGIDCYNARIDDDARLGVPPKVMTQQPNSGLPSPSTAISLDPPRESDEMNLIDVTVHLNDGQSLLMCCTEDTPALSSLFHGLMNRARHPNDVLFLDLGEGGSERVMFRQSELVSIETSPAVSDGFLSALKQLQESSQQSVAGSTTISNQHLPSAPGIPDNWKVWIWHNVSRGCSKDDIFSQLIENGFTPEQVKDELGYEPRQVAGQVEATSPPQKDLSTFRASPLSTRLAGDRLEIFSTDNFLDESECLELISKIDSGQTRSTVVGEQPVSDLRTSQTCQFNLSHPGDVLVENVTNRVCRLIGINPSYAEAVQGQVYGPGQEYRAHNDWFTPGTPEYEKEASDASGGQRSWSAIVYLNAVGAGGETEFPKLDLTIKPSPGRVVFWRNIDSSGVPNETALHRACPVEEGKKYILTFWFRSLGSGDMYCREPREKVPMFTRRGLEKTRISDSLQAELSRLYSEASPDTYSEEYVEGHYIQSVEQTRPSALLDIPKPLRRQIVSELQPLCEDWSNEKLEFSALYGIRTYFHGAFLRMHSDVKTTHIISAILNVSQQVNTPWALQIEDHQFREHAILLEPGEMLLYEGARLMHGRPVPLNGNHYANIFVHFLPVNFEAPT